MLAQLLSKQELRTMQRDYFTKLEKHDSDTPLVLADVIAQLAFNEQGLIPVIAQDAKTKAILMFAWMNLDALNKTISTGRMTYWSRSRNQLWIKGETTGHFQHLVSMAFDCDGDAVLCEIEQEGAACHTFRDTCFYLQVDAAKQQVWVK